ncbi:MAG: FeS-binding protein [Cellvibrionaceae bacterium]|nr:FeS-binding protein [Cellvibrionaceae bacterium]
MSRFPFPIPHGWFGLCLSHELEAGQVKKVTLAGRDFAVFRTESGEAAILDNYCPHLGSPLDQGCVVGESIRCPFHHWQFNGEGECTDIPYANRIPTRAVAETIPIQEINGMVMGWYHPEGREPYFELPKVDGLNGDEKWNELEFMDLELPTCIQEIAENDVDQAHFTYLHRMPAFSETETVIDGPIKNSVSHMDMPDDFLADAVADAHGARHQLERTSYGPGVTVVHGTGFQSMKNGEMGEFLLLNIATPIDDNTTVLRWTMGVSKNIADEDDLGPSILYGFKTGVDDDIPIWREKIYRANPVLCDGDGPINKHRKWTQQFYDMEAK